MSNACPLWAFVPDVLLPEPVFNKAPTHQKQNTFEKLPKSLKQAMARQPAQYLSAGQIDRVEYWLSQYFEAETATKFDQYPPWAMLQSAASDKSPQPFTQWFASLGYVKIDRDGVSFLPPEAINITDAEAKASWHAIKPLLMDAGWQVSVLDGLGSSGVGLHALCQHQNPLPMEQASPWSVQHIRLTDYLPMSDDCSDWRRMWHALQMELAQLPENTAREAAGQPTINCLWFWGGGECWDTSRAFPSVVSVGVDGVYPAKQITPDGNQALNRFIFWSQMLSNSVSALDNKAKTTVYCLDFEGWGADAAVFSVLENDVVQPMRMSGLGFGWVLMGQHGYQTLLSDWRSRFKFWKNTPDWTILAEPVGDMPTEQDLRAAYEAGYRDQTQIDEQW